MKSFNTVYNNQKTNFLNEKRAEIDKQHANLVEAIKREYGVNDFRKLNEADTKSYRTLINSMWTKERGLNEKGVAFINEAKQTLTKDSTKEQIENYFKKRFKASASKCVHALMFGERCEIVSDLKSEIEQLTGKKLNDNNMKKWIFEVCGKFLGESLKSTTF